jgi:predicted house-cleaning noncanonical NTP pyrophosphatase (MazG superfamily)
MKENNIVEYDKLIRDKIPEIIKDQGKRAVIEVLDADNYKRYLDLKLGEELKEYLEADSVEELADLVEVIYAILDYKGVSREDFEKIRTSKVQKRGAFKKRLLLNRVIAEK